MYKNSKMLLYVTTVMTSTTITVVVAILIVVTIVVTMFLLTEMRTVKIVSMKYSAIVQVVEKLLIEIARHIAKVKNNREIVTASIGS